MLPAALTPPLARLGSLRQNAAAVCYSAKEEAKNNVSTPNRQAGRRTGAPIHLRCDMWVCVCGWITKYACILMSISSLYVCVFFCLSVFVYVFGCACRFVYVCTCVYECIQYICANCKNIYKRDVRMTKYVTLNRIHVECQKYVDWKKSRWKKTQFSLCLYLVRYTESYVYICISVCIYMYICVYIYI